MGKKKQPAFTKEEQDFIDVCFAVKLSKDEIFPLFVFAINSEDDESKKSLFTDIIDYIIFRAKIGEKVTQSDILNFTSYIKRKTGKERFQYLPLFKVVQYKGKDTDEMIFDEYYGVNTVYGYNEDIYLIETEKGEKKEFPATDFIEVEPEIVKYVGSKEHPEQNNPNLELNKDYKVKKISFIDFTLNNGEVVTAYDVLPQKFKHSKPKKLKKLKMINALAAVRQALEFANVKHLVRRLNEESVFVSYNRDEPIKGKEAIIQHFLNQRNIIYDNNCNITVSFVKSTEDNEEVGCKKGDKFLLITYANLDKNDPRDPVYVEIDDYYIRRIEIKYAIPKNKKLFE